MKNYKIIVSICSILVITSIAFLPSLKNNFTNWDDDIYVTENADIRNLSWENIKTIFSSFYVVGPYIPLSKLSFSVEYHFFGLNPLAYHITNLTLHLFNCLLVFWLIFMLSGKVLVSFIVALLFGIHPLRVESVAWVTERKGVLYALFYLGALLCYLYYRKNESVKYRYLSLFLFTLSLLSKPMAVTFPFVLLLCDYLLGQKLERHTLQDKIPFFVLSSVFVIITLLKRYLGAEIRDSYSVVSSNNILNACYGLVFYLSKMMVPINLSCLYEYPLKTGTLLHSLFLFSPVVVAVLIISVAFSGRYTKKIIFGSLFFLITIFPVLQLIPIGAAVPADRFTYIPFIGLFYLGTECFFLLYLKKPRYTELVRIFLLLTLTGIVLTLSFLTWQRCKVWKDSLTLWNDVLKNYTSTPAVYNNRGNVYAERGEYEKAISDYNQAIRISPHYADAYSNRGVAYKYRGEYEKAISDYDQAIKIDPHHAKTYCNRGVIYEDKGEYEKAISDYNRAIRINPNYVDTYIYRAKIYYTKGEYEKAMSDYSEILRIDPNNEKAYNNRGVIYKNKGEYEQALSDYNQALKINSDYAIAYNNRGLIYQEKGEYEQALSDYNQALKINPNCVEAYYNRALAYFKIGKYDSAREDILKMQTLGYPIDSSFLDLFPKSSEGRN